MTEFEYKYRYHMIAIIATRQARERGYATGYEQRAYEMGVL